MIKKITLIILSLVLSVPVVFADQAYNHRGVFNKFTDWTATLGKPSWEKDQIVNDRIERRAERRRLEAEYHDKLVSIRNENISAEEMAQKLKDAYQEQKKAVHQLDAGVNLIAR